MRGRLVAPAARLGGLWLVVAACAPFRLTPLHSKITVFEVLLVVLAVAEALILVARRANLSFSPRRVVTVVRGGARSGLVRVLAALLAWCTLSVFWAADLALWERRTVITLEAVVAGATCCLATLRTGWDTAVRVVAWSGSIGAALALVWFYALGASPSLTLQPPPDTASAVSQAVRLGSPLLGPSNYYATFLLLTIPLTVLCVRTARWWWVGVVLQVLALVSTISRGATAGIIVAAVVVAPFVWRRRDVTLRRLGIAVGVVVVTAVVGEKLVEVGMRRRGLLVATVPPAPTSGAPSDTGGADGTGAGGAAGGSGGLGGTDADPDPARAMDAALAPNGHLDLLHRAVDVAKDHPVVGVGFGNWDAAVPVGYHGSAHFFLLQVVAEVGVVGLVLVLAWCLVVARRVAALPTRAARYAVGVALAAVLISSCVEASLEGVVFTWFLGCVIGAVAGARRGPVLAGERLW